MESWVGREGRVGKGREGRLQRWREVQYRYFCLYLVEECGCRMSGGEVGD